MKILSGTTDQYLNFIAVDATDLKTREPGLTGFTVYRSRNNGTATLMTTPTIAELDATNMPGVYTLLMDEDMAMDNGNISEEMIFHITQADMAPVDRVVELYGDLKVYSGPRGLGVYLEALGGQDPGSVSYIDGTILNPVHTIADAKLVADALGLKRIYLIETSSITLAATMQGYDFVGLGFHGSNIIALNSQDVSNSTFHHVSITGIQGGTGVIEAIDCEIDTGTYHIHAQRCGLIDGTTGITFSNNDDNVLDSCYSEVPGNGAPLLVCSAANLDLSVRHYSGGVEIKTSHPTATMSIETDGQVIFNADCNVNSDVTLRGLMTITDNTAGMSSITQDAVVNMIKINAEVDTAISDAALATAASISGLQDISVSDILSTPMNESYVANGAVPTLEQALMLIQQSLGDFSISGTVLTVNQVDGATVAATYTLDDDTNPTSRTRTT